MGAGKKKTYYQISFTQGQALGGVIVLLVALALAFFFGARAGFTRSAALAVSLPAEEPVNIATKPSTPVPQPRAASPTPTPAPVPSPSSLAIKEKSGAVSSPSRTVIDVPAAGLAAHEGETAPPPAAAPRPPAAGSYMVQVLSTVSPAEARRWKEKLATRHIQGVISRIETGHGRMFRVRVGPFAGKDAAGRMASRINTEFHTKSWVTAQ